jgi:hypothetical protein
VLVGETVSALYAGHRDSLHHDHVLADLTDRYAEIPEAIEASDGWVTSVRSGSPPLTILGSPGSRPDCVSRRTRPLEVQEIDLGGAGTVRVPTPAEALRIKAYLVVQRNQTRDCPTPPRGTVARRPSWRHTRTSTRAGSAGPTWSRRVRSWPTAY